MGLPDIEGLLESARRIQEEVARVRDTLGDKTVTGETGGGLVRCLANGEGEISRSPSTRACSRRVTSAWSKTSRWAP